MCTRRAGAWAPKCAWLPLAKWRGLERASGPRKGGSCRCFTKPAWALLGGSLQMFGGTWVGRSFLPPWRQSACRGSKQASKGWAPPASLAASQHASARALYTHQQCVLSSVPMALLQTHDVMSGQGRRSLELRRLPDAPGAGLTELIACGHDPQRGPAGVASRPPSLESAPRQVLTSSQHVQSHGPPRALLRLAAAC